MMSTILTVSVLLFPGILLSLRKHFFPFLHTVEKVPLYIAASLAYWVIGFWWLKYIPVPFTIWIIITVGVSASAYVVARITRVRHSESPTLPASPWTYIFFILICIPEIILATHMIAPSGQDMSMHAYITRVILQKDGFPITLLPLVPVNQFGLYPFGFSIITAVLSAVNMLPIYTNSLIVTAIVHILFDISLYTLLRSKFSPGISAFTAFIVAWTSHNPHLFVEWGANPSVLSFAFLIFSVAICINLKKPESVYIAVAFATASMLTNYMYVVTLGYILLSASIVSFPYIRRACINTHTRPYILAAAAACTMLLPFAHTYISRQGFTLSEPIRQYIQGLHRDETNLWNGTLTATGLWGISEVIAETIDHKLLAFYALCVFLLFRKKTRMFVYVHITATLTVMILIANARFWWLPFSSMLYPQRIALTLLIPISWGIAQTISLYKANRYGIISTAVGGVLILLMILQLRQPQFTKTALDHQLVTANDIIVLTWLKQHSLESDIIWNRYEDAGVWIPAIISRPITLYHTNPVDMAVLTRPADRTPDFAFIGEAMSQTGTIRDLVMETHPQASAWNFTLVYMHGNASVYRIDR